MNTLNNKKESLKKFVNKDTSSTGETASRKILKNKDGLLETIDTVYVTTEGKLLLKD